MQQRSHHRYNTRQDDGNNDDDDDDGIDDDDNDDDDSDDDDCDDHNEDDHNEDEGGKITRMVITSGAVAQRPVEELSRLCRFLGKERNEEFLQQVSEATAIDTLRTRKKGFWESGDFQSKASSYIYRKGRVVRTSIYSNSSSGCCCLLVT